MERTLNNKTLEGEGEQFACPHCGSTVFTQECYVKTLEAVDIFRKDGKITIVSTDVKEITENDIEYNNSFVCGECGNHYEVVSKDGADEIYDVELVGESDDGQQ